MNLKNHGQSSETALCSLFLLIYLFKNSFLAKFWNEKFRVLKSKDRYISPCIAVRLTISWHGQGLMVILFISIEHPQNFLNFLRSRWITRRRWAAPRRTWFASGWRSCWESSSTRCETWPGIWSTKCTSTIDQRRLTQYFQSWPSQVRIFQKSRFVFIVPS